MTDTIVLWLKSTALSHAMVQSTWLWPLCETLHFIGLALLLGTAGLFDLRLMGFLKRIPVSTALQLRPWAGVGVLINLVTGVMFFTGAPGQYIWNPAWYAKLSFLAIAIVNIVFFETRQGARMLAMSGEEDMPLSFKIAGAVSITSWLAVLYFGRMLPFIGNAF
jgi:multidrug transporter EmrE-like cation transporter